MAERQAAVDKLFSSSELVQLVGSENAKEVAADIMGDYYRSMVAECGASQSWPNCDNLIILNPGERDVYRDPRLKIDVFKDIARRDLAS